MKIEQVSKLVEATIVNGTVSAEREVQYGFASDLMSDVLTVTADGVLLITGLSNAQTVRTAVMSDIHAILICRNKRVTAEMQALAEEQDVVLLSTAYSVFRAVAELYNGGLKPIF